VEIQRRLLLERDLQAQQERAGEMQERGLARVKEVEGERD
jgi:hypothetical protein